MAIPVKLYSATSEHSIGLHQVRASDGVRIRQKRVAETDGAEVPYAHIAKGYELPDGGTVILDDDDLATLPVPTRHTIQVEQFVDETEVDPVLLQKTYYLEPDKTGVKPYALLRDALAESGRVGLVKVAIRQRETMAVLRVREGVFTLTTLLWDDEVREPDFAILQEDIKVSKAERAMADQLIDSMTAPLDLSAYTDDYTAAMHKLIAAKSQGKVLAPVAEEEDTADVVDLLGALQASLAAKEQSKDSHPAGRKRSTKASVKAVPDNAAEAKPAKAARRKSA